LPFEQLHHRRDALALARDVDVIGASLLKRETDEFAAALDGRPVVELVTHVQPAGALCASSVTGSSHSTNLRSSTSVMARCVIIVAGPAPCQCFSPGGNQTTSPGRTSRTLPPQLCTRPVP